MEMKISHMVISPLVLETGATFSGVRQGSQLSRLKGTGIDPSLSAGAFCGTKSGGRLRLICDRRPRNSQERSIRKVSLPSPPRFCRILLPRSHAIKISGRDLKDFYYNLEVDEERWIKQAWGPSVPASWFENLDDTTLDDASDFESWWGAERVLPGPSALLDSCNLWPAHC